MKYVVKAPKASCALHGQDVQRVFNHADYGAVAAGVGTDLARRGVGQVLALLTEDDILLDRSNGVGQGVGLFVGQPDDVVRQTLSAFGANAR